MTDGPRPELEALFRIAASVEGAVRGAIRSPKRGEMVAMGADGSPTEAIDRVAELEILRALDAERLDWNLLSEEAGVIPRGGARTLVVDPIDGSHNALLGLPIASVSLALGDATLGGIDAGVVRSLATGSTYWAARGGGAFRDGQPIRTRRWEPKREMFFLNLGRHATARATGLAARGRRVRSLGCASLEMAMVAHGGADAYLFENEVPERNLRVTDIAASYRILLEAGGQVTDANGASLAGFPLALGQHTSVLAVGDERFPERAPGGIPLRIGLTANPNQPRALALARHAAGRIGDRAELTVTPETAEAIRATGNVRPLDGMEADVLVTLGGDGTFLYTLQRTELPILAVHAGTVGFLAEVDGERLADFDRALDRLIAGDYAIEDRMKLALQVDGVSLPDATNEVVVHTSQVAKIREFEIGVDGRAIGRVRSDGIILATPTGSTSYALSALGPIVDPSIEAIVVAALAPFQLTQRAVLIDPLRTVTLHVADPAKDAVVVVDGQVEHPLKAGSRLRAYRSPRRASFVRFGPGFFRRMGGKGILPWRELPETSGGASNVNLPTAA